VRPRRCGPNVPQQQLQGSRRPHLLDEEAAKKPLHLAGVEQEAAAVIRRRRRQRGGRRRCVPQQYPAEWLSPQRLCQRRAAPAPALRRRPRRRAAAAAARGVRQQLAGSFQIRRLVLSARAGGEQGRDLCPEFARGAERVVLRVAPGAAEAEGAELEVCGLHTSRFGWTG
jgi:hypothetical protein